MPSTNTDSANSIPIEVDNENAALIILALASGEC
jgi:hypothetical protein